MNASAALPSATLRSNPTPQDASLFTIASDVGFGQIAPARARTGVPASRIGMPLSEVKLEAIAPYSGESLAEYSWGALLERAGMEQLENGRGYTLVLIGPAPGVSGGSWWNGSDLALVENSPLRD